MAEEQNSTDRGLFAFLSKKKEEDKVQDLGDKEQEADLIAEVEKVKIEDEEEGKEEEKKKHTSLHDKLQRSPSSSSSSSSDEEEGGDENKEKKKKKKGLKQNIEDKLHGNKAEEKVELKQEEEVAVVAPEKEDTAVVVEKVETTTEEEEEEKKGFLEKIKEKIHKKPAEEGAAEVNAPPPPVLAPAELKEGEKKSFIEKIKEKIPGYNKSNVEEAEKTAAS